MSYSPDRLNKSKLIFSPETFEARRFDLNPADSKKHLEKYDNYLTELFNFYPLVEDELISPQSNSSKDVIK